MSLRLDKKIAEVRKTFPYPLREEEFAKHISDEVNVIVHELVALFVDALQKDEYVTMLLLLLPQQVNCSLTQTCHSYVSRGLFPSLSRQSWMFLTEAVYQVIPYREFISGNQRVSMLIHMSWLNYDQNLAYYPFFISHPLQIIHYLERIHHHLDVHKERLFELNVGNALNEVFGKVCCNSFLHDFHVPLSDVTSTRILSCFHQDLSAIREKPAKPVKVYCPPTPPPKSLAPSVTRKPPVKLFFHDGKDPYVLERPVSWPSHWRYFLSVPLATKMPSYPRMTLGSRSHVSWP